MDLEWKKRLEQDIAKDYARERTESWIAGLQEAAQAVRDDPRDQSKKDELKKTCERVVGFLDTDVNKRWADNLYLLKQELERVKKEFGLL